MLFLGFSAGLPFPLVFTTLNTWLRDVGVERTTIGFFAWVGLTYSIKVFWAPVIDRARIPILTGILGQRRSWMLVAQTGVIIGLIGIAYTNPIVQITTVALFSLLIAFSSATQDVAVDAYRIEAVKPELQGAMAGTYQSGWRIAAALVGGAAALYLAEFFSWQVSYLCMAICMGVGVTTVLFIEEPEHSIAREIAMSEERVVNYLERAAHVPNYLRNPTAWFIGAVVCPFAEFFKRNGYWAIVLLLFIALYRVSDIVMANMAYPLYVDLDFSKAEIANVAKIFGITMTIFGAMFGGALVYRIGVLKTLLLGAILVAVTTLLFAQLAVAGKSLAGLALVISADNFSGGLAGSAFIAFLSRLTNTTYTATQYALFSSLMTLPAKFLSGFSGIIVDAHGYPSFFVYSACLGIPAIMLVIYLLYNQHHIPAPSTGDQ
ncbi:MAG: MFS transporter [Gammaproteobacteria bacterium]|nr:MFS transporter [Gammaproteobacteria bacterium]